MGRIQVPEQDIVIERLAVFRGKKVDILLGKKEVAEIKNFEVTGEQFARDLVVQRVVGVVAFLEEAADRKADLLGIRLGEDGWDGERYDQQPRQERDKPTKEIIHKRGQKGSQKSV